MPHFQHKSPNLRAIGPTLEIVILPPKPVVDVLKNKGQSAPSQKAMALIDTGASCTCIDKAIARDRLGSS